LNTGNRNVLALVHDGNEDHTAPLKKSGAIVTRQDGTVGKALVVTAYRPQEW
jgi:phosphohistidine swiveling domain-containing protein